MPADEPADEWLARWRRPRPSIGLRYLGGAADRVLRASASRGTFLSRAITASHDEFKSEWWYFTGNLDSADGRHFGFELTFFRVALAAACTA